MNEQPTWEAEHAAREVIAVMDRSTADLLAPVDRLEARARAGGRALRRRRRVAAAVAGLAAVTAVGLGTSLLTAGAGDQRPPVTTSPGPSPTESPDREVRSDPWWEMPAPRMRDVLGGLLPDNVRIEAAQVRTTDRGSGEQPGPVIGALTATVLNTAAGSGGLNVVLLPPQPAASPSSDGEPDLADRLSCPGNLDSPTECTVLRDEDGIPYARRASTTAGEITILTAEVLAPDGGLVHVATANTLDEKWGARSTRWGPEPPLSLDDVLAIAADPAWQEPA